MACMPNRCRCEERILAPFVSHYNRTKGTQFVFQQRLDLTGPSPQPEAAYADTETGRMLVLERKNFVWPADFAKLHDSLHVVSEIIGNRVRPALDPARAYRMTMRDDLRGSLPKLRSWADGVATAILSRMDAVNDGRTVRSRKAGREWSFREEQQCEREYYQPQTGLGFEFVGQPADLGLEDDSWATAGALQEILASTARKFDGYEHASRILVLDPHGDLRWSGSTTWKEVLAAVRVPTDVDEIWISMHDTITDLDCGWIHQPLWPEIAEQKYVFCERASGT